MAARLPRFIVSAIVLLIVASRRSEAMGIEQIDTAIEYRVEKMTEANRNLASRFGGPELALLEKLNRADLKHLQRLPQLIVPASWHAELDHSPFPASYSAASATPKLLIVDQPSQAFAA